MVDLGPDGLGFVVPSDQPRTKFAFSLRRIGKSSFWEAGLQEGGQVTFHVDDAGRVDFVAPLTTV